MSGLLNKLAGQVSGQKQSQGSQPSSGSGMLHKVTDAVTGQKHAQDYPNQQAPMNAGYRRGYPAQQHGFEQSPGQPTPYGYGSSYPEGGHNSSGGYQGGPGGYEGGHGGYEVGGYSGY